MSLPGSSSMGMIQLQRTRVGTRAKDPPAQRHIVLQLQAEQRGRACGGTLSACVAAGRGQQVGQPAEVFGCFQVWIL